MVFDISKTKAKKLDWGHCGVCGKEFGEQESKTKNPNEFFFRCDDCMGLTKEKKLR